MSTFLYRTHLAGVTKARRAAVAMVTLTALTTLMSCGDSSDAWDKLRGRESTEEPTRKDDDALASYVVRKQGATSTVSSSSGAWIATFTTGARTVTLAGPERTFAEPSARSPVRHTTWVRLLSKPFSGGIESAWLKAARSANEKGTPDALAIGMQYVAGAPTRFDKAGRQVAGDASYGPLAGDGTRQLGSDVDDYVRTKGEAQARTGLFGTMKNVVSSEELLARRVSLDCSGFVRMVFGFRDSLPGAGYGAPFALRRTKGEEALPRTAQSLFYEGPGRIIESDSGKQQTRFASLLSGDLVFFQADQERELKIDHVGIYLGLDTAGRWRFLSSRKSSDGPTLGDYKGTSLLDGSGLYARSFRAIRRL